MRLITSLLCLLIFVLLFLVIACNYKYLRNFINSKYGKSEDYVVKKKSANNKELIEHCDENKLLLQFARLYVISPERIILLVTNKSQRTTCQEISDVLQIINGTLSESRPLPAENLYVKLYNGLDYYNNIICLRNSNSGRTNHLTKYHDCIQELREDLIECEGPPDWFEKTNEAVVCQYYNDIVNCHYIRAAMLCGLKPALLLRSFSIEIMKEVVTPKCKVSKSLPLVEDPMPDKGCSDSKNYFQFSSFAFISLFSFYVEIVF